MDAAAAAEIEMNYMTMSKLKDDRIKRLEEMLADAHECLEKVSPEGTAIKDYSEERSLKAELARRDAVESRLLERLNDCDMEGASENEARIIHMTEAYDNLQSHFRDETLKMCQEIVELQMQIRFLEVEHVRMKEEIINIVNSAAVDAAGYEAKIFSVTDMLAAEQELSAGLREAIQWERDARDAEGAENRRVRALLLEARRRELDLMHRCQTLDDQVDWRRREQRDLADLHALMQQTILDHEQAVRGLQAEIEELKGHKAERDFSIDIHEQAALSRDHEFAALRKRFSWLQEEHRRVILEAEQMEINLENDKRLLRETLRKRDVTIDVQDQDKQAREMESAQERVEWGERLLTRAKVDLRQNQLNAQASEQAQREEAFKLEMSLKSQEIRDLKTAAVRQFDIQQQSALAAEAEFAAARERWKARLKLQDTCVEENQVLRKELARIAGDIKKNPASALLSQDESIKSQEVADELEALLISTRLQAVQNVEEHLGVLDPSDSQDPRNSMAGDWGRMSLPEIEVERQRENEGLEAERDRIRRGEPSMALV